MSIEDRLRSGLAANTEHLEPNLERELSSLLRRSHRRRQARALAAGVLVAAVLAVAAWLGGVPGEDHAGRPDLVKDPKQTFAGARTMEGVDGPLQAGTWIVPMVGSQPHTLPRAVVEVPPGYGSPGGWVVDRGADGDPENHGDVAFWTVDTVRDDPCKGGADADPGPTISDLVDALTAQPGTRTTRPTPVTVDGHPGRYLEVTVPRAGLGGCHLSSYTLWRSDDGAVCRTDIPGTVFRFWILDVDGTRVVMTASTTPGENATETAEVLGIAASTHFIEPLEPTG